MNKLIILLLSFITSVGIAQEAEYSIVVKDIETLLPIENVTIVILKTKQILLTNQEGKVSFVLNGGSNVQISETNYENITVRWANLKESEFVVYLKSKHNKLDEIVVSKENPQKTLQRIVSNSAKNLAMPYRLKVYVREFFMLNNKYSYYNDGLVNFQFSGTQKNVSTTLLVEQNRSYGLLETDVSADLKGYDLNNIMENYSNLSYFDPILDPKAKKDYNFTTKGHPTNSAYYIMSVTPLDKAKEAVDNFEIVYDPDKKLIIEFTISIAPGVVAEIEEKAAIGSKNITRSIVNVNYRIEGTDYYVLNSNEEIGYDLVMKEGVKNIQVRNNFITTHFDKQKFTFKDSDVFKDKTLFNKKNKIMTNYWNISGFTSTEEEKKIIDSLEFKL
ncbi:hypothetical protein [Flavobacterium hercynium]|uniref:Carboxypeptidase-like regulatory domain-containing protein n=1 Tax=Flavobacterium hercynium TaxID=387094 RepID=A0A226GWE1_9FLAO|nr:hypothetical protein [Flavobacterium hercynium]OXA86347.1 hypothetical protein B0A66_17860 [Flavobacterium hercynium]SMP17928.1 hypothetical protein SAMN06265346_105189 [Flavobacterium hercynium]